MPEIIKGFAHNERSRLEGRLREVGNLGKGHLSGTIHESQSASFVPAVAFAFTWSIVRRLARRLILRRQCSHRPTRRGGFFVEVAHV